MRAVIHVKYYLLWYAFLQWNRLSNAALDTTTQKDDTPTTNTPVLDSTQTHHTLQTSSNLGFSVTQVYKENETDFTTISTQENSSHKAFLNNSDNVDFEYMSTAKVESTTNTYDSNIDNGHDSNTESNGADHDDTDKDVGNGHGNDEDHGGGDHGNNDEHGNEDDHGGGDYHSNHSDNHTGEHSSHHGVHVASWNFAYVQEPLVITIFVIVAGLLKVGFHHADFLSSKIPESCILIILGTIVGAIIYGVTGHMDHNENYGMSPTVFFLFLLPPIILEAAYSLYDRVFADNLGTILVYAVIGTVLNFVILGFVSYGLAYAGAMGSISISLVQCLVFGSLIVAVDPVAVLAIFQEIGVHDLLYFLVFGESLLNDAVTVVLYNMMKTFNLMDDIPASQIILGIVSFFTISLGGLLIGLAFGICTALLTRVTKHVVVVEPLGIFGLAYAAYLCAELFHFSGIISMIGCGLVQAAYAFRNISSKSKTTVIYFSKMMSCLCDSIIFMFLGLAIVRTDHVWHLGFILWTLALCLIIRFIVVYFLTFIANQIDSIRYINIEEQFIMAYGGLRGAVAFSLVTMLDPANLAHQRMFETTTLCVIIFTVFIQGITIKPLVNLLRIKKNEKEVSLYEEINSQVTDHLMSGVENVMGHFGSNAFRDKILTFESNYISKWLLVDPSSNVDYLLELCEEIQMIQHYEHVGSPDDIISEIGSLLDQGDDIHLGSIDMRRPSAFHHMMLDTHEDVPQKRRISLLPDYMSPGRKISVGPRAVRKISVMKGNHVGFVDSPCNSPLHSPLSSRRINGNANMSPVLKRKGQHDGTTGAQKSKNATDHGQHNTSVKITIDKDAPEAYSASPPQRRKVSNIIFHHKSHDEDEHRKESKSGPNMGRRGTLFQKMFVGVQDNEISQPSGNDLRRWMVNNNLKRRGGKNLIDDGQEDILQVLREKHLRTERYMRARAKSRQEMSSCNTSIAGHENQALDLHDEDVQYGDYTDHYNASPPTSNKRKSRISVPVVSIMEEDEEEEELATDSEQPIGQQKKTVSEEDGATNQQTYPNSNQHSAHTNDDRPKDSIENESSV